MARTSERGHFSGAWIPLLWTACAALPAGCGSLEHIRLYRDARDDFSTAAREDNLTTLANVFPDAQTIREAAARLPVAFSAPPEGFDLAKARRGYERWYQVHAELAALDARAESALRQDRLYGSSRALEVIARARRDLYGHVLSVGGAAPGAGPIPPLTESAGEAERLLGEKGVEIFPRDEYLLRSLRPSLRYEIAYLNALRALAPPAAGLELKTAGEIAGQMALAEAELAAEAASAPSQVAPMAAMSRMVMLVSGEFLVQAKARQRLPLPRESPLLAQHPGLKLLADRIASFRERVRSEGTPERDLFLRLGLEPTGQNLTTWGLGEVAEGPR
jgi:hypothetical protein